MPTARGGRARRRFVVRFENLVDDDDDNADDGAQTQQTPVLGSTDDTLCEGGNQRGLRSSKRVSTSVGSSLEAEGILHEVQNRRNDKRAKNNTDDQSHLLLPRSRVHQLTGLEVLQIIIRNRCNTEDNRGGEERVGNQGCCLCSSGAVTVDGNNCQRCRERRPKCPRRIRGYWTNR